MHWLTFLPPASNSNSVSEAPSAFLARMRNMPKLVTEWGSGGAHYALWPAQIGAITNLEKSLAANKPNKTRLRFIVLYLSCTRAWPTCQGNNARQNGWNSPYQSRAHGGSA